MTFDQTRKPNSRTRSTAPYNADDGPLTPEDISLLQAGAASAMPQGKLLWRAALLGSDEDEDDRFRPLGVKPSDL